MKEGYTCEDGYAARCVYKGTPMCGASKAELKASLSYLVVTNYSKWTSNKRFGQGLSHIKRVYFDEAHNAPNAIADAVRVELNHKEIEDGLRVSFPRGHDSEDMNVWRQWASTTKGYADEALKEAYKRIQDANDPKPAWVRHYNHMRNLCRKLTVLTTARAVDWIVDQTETGYVFDPIRPGRYAEPYLFLQVPKVIMISATIREKTGFMCHISRENMKFQEFPSDFDPKRSPIYYVPTMRVDSNANDLGQLWAVLDRVMSRRRDRKGVVHSTSFERQREIRDRSRFASAMILNKKGQPVADAMEEFFQAGPGTTFISPSVCEGYDFKQDKARWQFMCKVPFEPPSKIVKAREADDKEYRGYKAMQALVQSFGRGMREHTDWCENFICDMHMDWFYPKYSHLAPKSFNKFIKAVSILPPPMNY
jgi:Rad3-related DNA helicase